MQKRESRPPVTNAVEEARREAQATLAVERDGVEHRRVHRFLVVMMGLLTLSWLGVFATIAGGELGTLLIVQSIASMTAMTLTTGLAWLGFRLNPHDGPKLVTYVLYIAAIVPTFYFYFSGEFESMALGLVVLPVIMAPMFTSKRHAWGIAISTSALYVGLVTARHYDLIPAGYMVDVHQEAMVRDAVFLSDTVAGFLILIFCVAWLAGETSLDIATSQKELEEEVDNATRRLARANAELNARNRALGEFNAALSHDFKSPLQTALLAAETLIYSQPGLSEEQHKLAESIVNSASRMGSLSGELLKLSLKTDVLGDGECVALKDVFAQVVEDLGARLAESRAELIIDGDLPDVLANPSLLREAVQNLVENALKYGDADAPRIRVEEAVAASGKVAFAIEDNGRGIPEDQRDFVFRPFLRLDRDKDRGDGVGAGLAIVQRIVSVHGGRVRVEEGKVLKGARFVVELSAFGAQETLGG